MAALVASLEALDQSKTGYGRGVSRRLVVFGGGSGLEIWGPALGRIAGFSAEFIDDHANESPFARFSLIRSLRDVRRSSKGAEAVIVVSTLLGAYVAATERRAPVVAIDVGAARLAAAHPHLARGPLRIMLGLPRMIVGVTTAHGAALAAIRPRSGTVSVVHQPARPAACEWRPNLRAPYVLSVGSSGRDLGSLCAAARGLPFEVGIVEGGHELVPARGTSVPDRLPSNIRRYGQVTWEAYLNLLEGASALVLPLRYSDYPVGITVLLDAMAAGIPVVATAVPSVTDYQGEATAFMVPVGDVGALAGALRVAVEDRNLATRMADEARRHVQAIASPDVVAARFVDVLGELA